MEKRFFFKKENFSIHPFQKITFFRWDFFIYLIPIHECQKFLKCILPGAKKSLLKGYFLFMYPTFYHHAKIVDTPSYQRYINTLILKITFLHLKSVQDD